MAEAGAAKLRNEPKSTGMEIDTKQSDRSNGLFSLFRGVNWTKYAMVVVLILLGLAFHIMTKGIFLTPRNLSTLSRQVAVLGVATSGMVVLLVMGQFDLSVGSAMYLVSVIAAAFIVQLKLPLAVALAAALAAGLAIGAWQGFWVSRLKVPAFVVTLGGMLAWRGLGYVHTGGATVGPVGKNFQTISNSYIPKTPSYIILGFFLLVYIVFSVLQLRNLDRAELKGQKPGLRITARILVAILIIAFFAWAVVSYRGIPMAVVVLAAVIAVLTFIQSRTVLGRNMYAIGSNRQAAALAGINIERHLLLGFIIMGLMYFVAGVLSVARISGAVSSGGQGLELEAIAASVIGGTSLSGGIGTVPGAIIGALVLSFVDNGMSLMNISSFWQMVVKAQLLLFAVLFDVYSTRKRRI
jgi:D-xylose transport system permease protein